MGAVIIKTERATLLRKSDNNRNSLTQRRDPNEAPKRRSRRLSKKGANAEGDTKTAVQKQEQKRERDLRQKSGILWLLFYADDK